MLNTEPCIKCGAADRLPRGRCRPCENKRARARYALNLEGMRAKGAVRRDRNRNQLRASCRARRLLNPHEGRDYYRKDIVKRMLESAKKRANKKGLAFNIDRSDISIPDTCPILGIQLVVGGQGMKDSSPTLDRIENKLGYVHGNVSVISYRANRIKSDATLDELIAITQYIRKHLDNIVKM